MKNILILSFILVLISCNQEAKDNHDVLSENNVLSSLGLSDYESLIRHPVEMNTELDSLELPKLWIEEPIYNFDTITQGSIIKKRFNFINTGHKALYILDTKVSCGCTIASVKNEAILPNETGEIEVEFDSSEKTGYQDRSILLITNSIPNEAVIRIQGYIKD